MRISDPKPVERVRSVDDLDESAGSRAKGGDKEVADRVSLTDGADSEASVEKKKEVEVAAAAVRRELASSRSSHLAHIEAAVRNGTYRPDPRLIAERILQSAALDAQIDASMRTM